MAAFGEQTRSRGYQQLRRSDIKTARTASGNSADDVELGTYRCSLVDEGLYEAKAAGPIPWVR